LKKIGLIFIFLIVFGMIHDLSAQTGGRKREHRNQRKSSAKFKRNPSAGNADAFARGGKKRSSSRKKSAWVYRPTPSSKKQRKEQRHLFKRYKTKGGRFNEGFLARQNGDRAKSRVRGNKVFHKRKF
jgi:hypothetical protein